jgi:hypothetical protein
MVGSLLAGASPASAAPHNCSHGISYNQFGGWTAWYAWANCRSGTGYFRVGASCPWYGSCISVYGETKRPGQGQSRAACPNHVRPVGTWVSTWN